MPVVIAEGPALERILDDTYPIWGEELTRQAYGRWNHAQCQTVWGREHLRRVALVDGGEVVASAKRYDFTAKVDGRSVPVVGIGAVFTPESKRGRGHARALIEEMLADAARRGCAYALLFSEIDPDYYARMGFAIVPRETQTFEVIPGRGAPATLVRHGETDDLPVIADITAQYAAPARFALDRTPDLIAFFLTRRRLLAGLGPAGLRQVEFFVSEEGRSAVAYVIISRGPTGDVLEECGDRDPSGARIGAILQVLAAREPAGPRLTLVTSVPESLRPPQMRLTASRAADPIMMIRALGEGRAIAIGLSQTVYWTSDVF